VLEFVDWAVHAAVSCLCTLDKLRVRPLLSEGSRSTKPLIESRPGSL
jgi:hypothetical protein